MTTTFQTVNKSKVNFDETYHAADPRTYFTALGSLDYIIPHVAERIFQQLLAARRSSDKEVLTVLDLGCSYGLNGALIKYPVRWDELHARYTNPAIQVLSSEDLMALDRNYFRAWPSRTPVRVIGVDASRNAIDYAAGVGTIDTGFAVDLEADEPPTELAALLPEVDLVISTGCIGYVTERTLSRLAKATRPGRPAWYASFVLRMFPYGSIEHTLAEHGLATEKMDGVTFVQRRFANSREQQETLKAIGARGLTTHGIESDGYMHAELFVSRTPEEVAERPLQTLVSVASGLNKLPRLGGRPALVAGRGSSPVAKA